MADGTGTQRGCLKNKGQLSEPPWSEGVRGSSRDLAPLEKPPAIKIGGPERGPCDAIS